MPDTEVPVLERFGTDADPDPAVCHTSETQSPECWSQLRQNDHGIYPTEINSAKSNKLEHKLSTSRSVMAPLHYQSYTFDPRPRYPFLVSKHGRVDLTYICKVSGTSRFE
jgi:hypothetical protein